MPILDLPQKCGDVGVFINKQRLDADALQIIYGKLLFYLSILERIIVRKTAAHLNGEASEEIRRTLRVQP